MWQSLLLAFIPIFVAVDAIGVLPIFASLVEGESTSVKTKVVLQSMLTAFCLAVGFIMLGEWIFKVLGITIGDFAIAGGALLFVLAITDIMNPDKKRRVPTAELGAVPLGTPLIVGPAVLTTSMVMLGQYGPAPTMISVLVNICIAGAIFLSADRLIKVIGEAGTKALSKIMSLLLAAIAVMMMRKGVFLIIGK